jgi:hypothetical protein
LDCAILKSYFRFEAPNVKIIFTADIKELDSEKGVFDQYDAGIFSMQGEQLEKWKLIFETKNWTIEYTRRMADSDLCVDL